MAAVPVSGASEVKRERESNSRPDRPSEERAAALLSELARQERVALLVCTLHGPAIALLPCKLSDEACPRSRSSARRSSRSSLLVRTALLSLERRPASPRPPTQAAAHPSSQPRPRPPPPHLPTFRHLSTLPLRLSRLERIPPCPGTTLDPGSRIRQLGSARRPTRPSSHDSPTRTATRSTTMASLLKLCEGLVPAQLCVLTALYGCSVR